MEVDGEGSSSGWHAEPSRSGLFTGRRQFRDEEEEEEEEEEEDDQFIFPVGEEQLRVTDEWPRDPADHDAVDALCLSHQSVLRIRAALRKPFFGDVGELDDHSCVLFRSRMEAATVVGGSVILEGVVSILEGLAGFLAEANDPMREAVVVDRDAPLEAQWNERLEMYNLRLAARPEDFVMQALRTLGINVMCLAGFGLDEEGNPRKKGECEEGEPCKLFYDRTLEEAMHKQVDFRMSLVAARTALYGNDILWAYRDTFRMLQLHSILTMISDILCPESLSGWAFMDQGDCSLLLKNPVLVKASGPVASFPMRLTTVASLADLTHAHGFHHALQQRLLLGLRTENPGLLFPEISDTRRVQTSRPRADPADADVNVTRKSWEERLSAGCAASGEDLAERRMIALALDPEESNSTVYSVSMNAMKNLVRGVETVLENSALWRGNESEPEKSKEIFRFAGEAASSHVATMEGERSKSVLLVEQEIGSFGFMEGEWDGVLPVDAESAQGRRLLQKLNEVRDEIVERTHECRAAAEEAHGSIGAVATQLKETLRGMSVILERSCRKEMMRTGNTFFFVGEED